VARYLFQRFLSALEYAVQAHPTLLSELPLKIRHSIVSLLLVCSSVLVASNVLAASKKPVHQELAAGSALLVDLNTNKVLYSSNPNVVLPIASVTKLMTAVVTLDAKLPMEQMLDINIADT